jgi:hypothetical protein
MGSLMSAPVFAKGIRSGLHQLQGLHDVGLARVVFADEHHRLVLWKRDVTGLPIERYPSIVNRVMRAIASCPCVESLLYEF